MKKNLLSILILALLIVNIVLTSIMMFSVTGASKRTTELVTDIASVLQLEIGADGDGEEAVTIPLSQTEVYDISESMTIAMRSETGDGSSKQQYCLLSVALSMNTKDKGYKTYGDPEKMASYESLITSEITNIIGSYTVDELKESATQDEARKKILTAVQKQFDSEFIYNVSFSDIKFQ